MNFVLNTKCYVWGKSSTTHHCVPHYRIFKHGDGCIMLWVFMSSAWTREFLRIKINRVELSTGKILEENLVQSANQQTLEDSILLSVGQYCKTQGQIYTGVRHQDDIECS
jgi:hypothetical protein